MHNQDYFFQLLIPLAALATSIAIHAFVAKLSPQRELLHSVLLGLMGGMLMLLFLSWRWPAPILGEVWSLRAMNVFLYGAAGYCYLHFINIGEASLRIRLLKEIHRCSGGMSRESIELRYNTQRIVDARLTRLVRNGQLRLQSDRYFIAGKQILWLARFFRCVKKVFFGAEKN